MPSGVTVMTARACPQCRAHLPADAPEGLCPSCLLREGLSSTPEEVSTTGNPPAPAALAPLFPQLEVLELLGRGGMGAVYKARQKKLDRLVALKVLPAQAGRDPAFAERFTREARALARLSHAHIVGVHDFGEVEGLYYLVMELVEGVNLRQAQAAGQLRPHLVLPLVGEVCAALQYAHEQGVVHRDIKPENILLDRHGHVKVADFGLAKLLGHAGPALTLTGSQQVMGTPHYMAPEQMDRPLTVDHRADIYSLGVVFYELLTGELPLGRFAPPSRKAGVDVRLDGVVLRALERDPACRYQRVSEVKTAVEALGQAPAAGEGRGAAWGNAALHQEVLALLGVMLGLALVALGLWWTKSALFLVGIPLIGHAASLVTWRPVHRFQAGLLLAFGGLTLLVHASQELNSYQVQNFSIVVGIWASAVVVSIWRGGEKSAGTGATAGPAEPGLSREEARALDVLRRFQSSANLYLIPDIPVESLHTARRASKVPPEERALALLDFTDDEHNARQNLLFGGAGLYFHVEHNGEEVTGSVSYEELPRRAIVNHGKEVYLGGGPALAPPDGYETVDCETIANLLNALKEALRARPTSTGADSEGVTGSY